MYTNHDHNSITTCAACGCIIEDVDPIYVNGEDYCPDCAERLGFVRCDRCGEWCDPSREDMIEYDGECICESCREDLNLVQCDECGEWYKPVDLTQVNGGWRNPDLYLCESCLEDALERERVFRCDDCEEYYDSHAYDSYTTNSGWTICECCRSDHWYYCEGCGELYPEDQVTWSDADDCYYCDDCFEDHASCVHDYGFRPRPVFHGTPTQHPVFGDPLTIGFELEVDDGGSERDCAAEIMDNFDEDTLYLKHDSSVTFEIVTHPHTLRSYLEGFDLEKLCRIPLDHDFSSHNCGTCGLHMHVGRAQLGDTAEARTQVVSRIALLMYRHWNSLVKFSRRREDQLSHWAQAPRFDFRSDIQYDEATLYQLVSDYYDCLGRYQALNLCNRSTIEFRLWRGSLKPDTIRATLQLTSNIVRYAMEHTMEDVVKSEWTDITNFETIPALTEYLEERELVAGLEARTIPYNNVVANPRPTGDFRYNIGEHVAFAVSRYLVSTSMVGQSGVIVHRVTDETGVRYLIRLDPSTDPDIVRNFCHDGDGRTPDRDGYWAYEEELALLDPESAGSAGGFRLGDRVRMADGREAPFGRTGTVVIVDGPASIGVRFDGFACGHNLGQSNGTNNN